MIRLSVLDQSPIRSGGTAADAVRETLQLAETADRLGYHRYWLAEHHSHGGLAGPSPEILIGQVAARTKEIRVGSGGVMLSHYSPLKVAENFRVLETLYPGRIDIGVGRAPGSDRLTSRALANGGSPFRVENFPQMVSDLLGFLEGKLEEGHPFEQVRAMPDGPTAPEAWLLGSSDQSALLAAHFGCAFSFAHFINNYHGPMRKKPTATPPAGACSSCASARGSIPASPLPKRRFPTPTPRWSASLPMTRSAGPSPERRSR